MPTANGIKREGRAPAILDLGCGTGELAPNFLRSGYSYTGIDIEPERIQYAHEVPAIDTVTPLEPILDLAKPASGERLAPHLQTSREIIRVATELRADAVVVGASSRFGHRFVGSMAVRLVKAGRWPVTVVP